MVSTTPRTASGAVKLIDAFLATGSDALGEIDDSTIALLKALRRFLKRLT